MQIKYIIGFGLYDLTHMHTDMHYPERFPVAGDRQCRDNERHNLSNSYSLASFHFTFWMSMAANSSKTPQSRGLIPRKEIDQELVSWVKKNLKNTPEGENYEKMISGVPYNPFEPDLVFKAQVTGEKVRQFNTIATENHTFESIHAAYTKKVEILKDTFGQTKDIVWLTAPFSVDFGFNVSVGEHFYANFNVCFLDSAPIIFGDEVIVGPNTTFVTATHPVSPEKRARRIVYALPIKVGNNVWIGANVTILPGVTIGDNSTIAAGAVVREDVPPRTVVGGVPARVLKNIPEENSDDEEGVEFSLPTEMALN